MTTAHGQRKSKEAPNPRAAEAFLDFVRLGPKRSLPKLAELYQNRTEPVPTKQLSRLKVWSTKYKWQERVEQVDDEEAEAELRRAARMDAQTFNRTSEELNRRSAYANGLHMDELVRMRETVRKPAPKGGTSVTVNVEIRHIAEKLAHELGIDASELIADAERIASGAWGDS